MTEKKLRTNCSACRIRNTRLCRLGLFRQLVFCRYAGAFSFYLVEDDLADTEGSGGDFEVFVVADVLHGLLKAHLDGGRAGTLLVGTLGAHIGEVLGGDDVDDDVVARTEALADDLTAVDMLARLNEERSAVLQLADAVSCGLAGLLGDEGAVLVVLHVALPGLELEEAVGDDGLAVGGCAGR